MQHTDLIRALLSNDNIIRRQAETTYTQHKAHHRLELTTALLTLTCIQTNGIDQETRAFAPVLLRRLLETEGAPEVENVRSNMKQQLLTTLVQENQPSIRRKVSHVIAQLARLDTQWPDLLPTIVNLTQSSDVSLQIAALEVLATLSEYTGQQLKAHHEQLGALFGNFVASTGVQIEVRVAAWKALSAFVLNLESSETLQPYTQLLPPFLQILEQLLQRNDELSARELLTSFLAMIEVHPSLLFLHLDIVGRALLSIAQAQTLVNDTRVMGLECLLSICEHASQTVRTSKPLLDDVIPCLLSLMAEMNDDPRWVEQFDDQKDDTGIRISDASAATIDRITHSLGGKIMVPLILPWLQQYMGDSSSWQQRHAALTAIGLMAKGAKEFLFQELDVWLPRILTSLHDGQYPRVRHAALSCIGHLADDFGSVERGKNFQTKYHEKVLTPLLPMLFEHENVMRNRGLAASVICNFCHPQNCRTQYILPILEPLLSALFQALQSSPRQVQEQAITAVACVANVVGDAFVLYYNVFMPVVKQVLTQAHGKQYALLRGKSMECVALIGQAVGKEAFLQDAKEVMNILLRHETDDSGIEVQYLTQACVRIGSVLQEDFVTYLPLIIPRLLQQAATQTDIVLLDWNEETRATDDDDDDALDGIDEIVVDVQGQGKKKLQIQTSALQEKELGLNMLYQLAMDLKGAFLPYVDPVIQVLLPLLKFKYMESIRMISGLTMAKLLHATVAGTNTTSPLPQKILERCFEPLIQALLEESDMECIMSLSEAIACVLEECKEANERGYQVGIPLSHLPPVYENLLSVSHASVLRRLEDLNDGVDDDEEEQNAEDEDAILQNVVDSLGWTIKQYKQDAVPLIVTHVFPVINQYLDPSFPAAIRAHFICIVDDLLEFGGIAIPSILANLLPHIWNGLEDSNPSVIRAAAYGAGVCAQHCGPAFEPHCVATLQRVWTCIQALEHYQVETEQAAARDNCVSAIGKFCMYRAHLVDAQTLLGLWLNCLPLQSDGIEARTVHAEFVSMVEATNMDLLGENYVHLPLVLKKFAQLVSLDLDDDYEPVLDDETKARLVNVLNQIQTTYPRDVVQSAWSSLSEEEQQAFGAM